VTLLLDHVADFYRRYPGDPLSFFTRIKAQKTPLPAGARLTARLPLTTRPTAYRALVGEFGAPQVAVTPRETFVVWTLDRAMRAGDTLEFQIETEIMSSDSDFKIESAAWLTEANAPTPLARASVTVAVAAQGRYLQHLPSLYADDELMGHFLMLFESFWKPIDQQIAQLEHYFDPGLTPPGFLPWLAQWINLTLDERWPEAKRRQLLRNAMRLYRQRGTRAALQTHLEIYTGARPHIAEHGSNNFRLGSQARLGPGVALGTINQPHAFTVTLQLPPVAAPKGTPKREIERLEEERRKTIVAIIEAEKPAHATYTLRLDALAGIEGRLP
jgi:phage tail-like protein